MLSSARAEGLQTDMLGAFGKPRGTMARVNFGQVIMSICTYQAAEQEAWDWGLTQGQAQAPRQPEEPHFQEVGLYKFNAYEFWDMVAEKQLIQMAVGSNTKYIPNCAPLDRWRALHS